MKHGAGISSGITALIVSLVLVFSGTALAEPDATYRVVTNDFMYNGGDEYTTFQQSTNPTIYSDVLLSDVMVAYLRTESPITQRVEGRITTVQ